MADIGAPDFNQTPFSSIGIGTIPPVDMNGAVWSSVGNQTVPMADMTQVPQTGSGYGGIPIVVFGTGIATPSKVGMFMCNF